MNENLNLCKILKGLEGVELYSTILDEVIITRVGNGIDDEYPIEFNAKNSIMSGSVTIIGTHFKNKGECTLFPSKEQRDWSKFEPPISVDTPMMCSDNGLNFELRYYYREIGNKHKVFDGGCNSKQTNIWVHYNYIIPFDKFNPNNIEETLKYNIQK